MFNQNLDSNFCATQTRPTDYLSTEDPKILVQCVVGFRKRKEAYDQVKAGYQYLDEAKEMGLTLQEKTLRTKAGDLNPEKQIWVFNYKIKLDIPAYKDKPKETAYGLIKLEFTYDKTKQDLSAINLQDYKLVLDRA